ncbi:Uncharacterised protein [Edwardsiella hoshinae]|uniref:Uncharacterized protein n=1 Tax=Edwardsiella hoshinae TaxID=93378 RepID=A0A376DMZ1_9GAMM|nr:Uncharacterised protein [Edwardsiella hoshinae]
MMIDSLYTMLSHGVELSSVGGSSSHAAVAAVLCAALFHLLG